MEVTGSIPVPPTIKASSNRTAASARAWWIASNLRDAPVPASGKHPRFPAPDSRVERVTPFVFFPFVVFPSPSSHVPAESGFRIVLTIYMAMPLVDGDGRSGYA